MSAPRFLAGLRLRARAIGVPSWARIVILSAVLAVLAVGTAMYRESALRAVQSHPYFRVGRVLVSGAGSLVSVSELRDWLGIRRGESVWSVDLAELRARAEAHPMIRAATVRRVFPDTLEIRVRERRPAAITVLDDLYYVDRRGDTFGPLTDRHNRDFPIFTGLADGGDGQRRWALRRALHLLRRSGARPGGIEISEMHLDPQEGLILYPDRPRVPVFLGWCGWERRLRRAERVLSKWDESSQRLARIDLRFRDQVVVRLRQPKTRRLGAEHREKLST